MRKIANLFVVFAVILTFSLPNCVNAKGKDKEIDVEDLIEEKSAAKDCNFLYILTGDKIDKYSLPDLQLITSAVLPSNTRGKAIDIAGGCSDPNQTILVIAKRKRVGEVLLSLNRDLQIVGELLFEDIEDDDEDEDDDDDNNDEDGDEDDEEDDKD